LTALRFVNIGLSLLNVPKLVNLADVWYSRCAGNFVLIRDVLDNMQFTEWLVQAKASIRLIYHYSLNCPVRKLPYCPQRYVLCVKCMKTKQHFKGVHQW